MTMPSADSAYHIVSKANGKCFDIKEGKSDENYPVLIHSFHGGENQQFYIKPLDGEEGYYIQAVVSRKCLGVMNSTDIATSPIVQTAFSDDVFQKFTLLPVNNEAFMFKIKGSGQVIDILDGKDEEFAEVVQMPESGTNTQVWELRPLAAV